MSYNSQSIVTPIATHTRLGVVQVGSGLKVDDSGVISTIVAPGGVPVKLVSNNYEILTTDYYIGVTVAPVNVTLPLGILGKFYIIKNQSYEGVVKVVGFAGQKIDNLAFKILEPDSSLMVMFDGNRWNIIQ